MAENERSPESELPSGPIARLALFGARRPWHALVISAVLFVLGLSLLPGLKISTARSDLVSGDNPYQKRLLSFYDRFGHPDMPIFVVSGGTEGDRRRVVDALSAKLESVPELEGRVLGRIEPETISDILLLVEPKALEALGKELGADENLADVIEGGLPRWFSAIQLRAEKALDEGSLKNADPDKDLTAVASLVSAFESELSGRSSRPELSSIVKAAVPSANLPKGMDDEGYLVGSGGKNIVALFPTIKSDEGYELKPLVTHIRSVRDEVLKQTNTPEVKAELTGMPGLVTDELEMVQHDLGITGLASTVLIALTLYLAFRSVRQATVGFLPLAFGTILTFAIARLVVGKLTLITASFASVLLGLGDFGVHIQVRYGELLRAGMERQKAMETALLKSGKGLVLGTLTTAMAFLTTMATEFTAFAQLGLITTLGLLVMFAGTFMIIPPAVLLVLGKKPRPAPELPGMRWLAAFVFRRPKSIVGIAIVSTALCAIGLPSIRFSGRYFDFLPPDVESAHGLKLLEEDELLTPFVANVSAPDIEDARVLADKLRSMPSVASVESPSDFLPPLDPERLASLKQGVARLGRKVDFEKMRASTVSRADVEAPLNKLADTVDEMAFALGQAEKSTVGIERVKASLVSLKKALAALPNEGKDALGRIQTRAADVLERALVRATTVAARGAYAADDLPLVWRHRYVSLDGKEVAIYVHPKGDVWDPDRSRAFARDVESLAPAAAGLGMTLFEHQNMLVRGFERATALAALLVFVILYWGFRNLKDMLVASVPLVLGAIWMLGTMPMLGIPFNHANMVVLPLLLGLGVDAGAHIMERYRQSREANGGIGDLKEMLSGTGGAVLIASLTTIFGFSVMMFARYRAMFGIGLIMTIGMSATLIMSVVVIPAILVLMKRVR